MSAYSHRWGAPPPPRVRHGSQLSANTRWTRFSRKEGHHLNCPSAREVCRLAWAWDTVSGSLTERPSADGEAVISGFGEATVDLGDSEGRPVLPAGIPAAVLDRHLAGRRACGSPDEADDFTVSYPAVASTPDVNGDGKRDWVLEAPSACEGLVMGICRAVLPFIQTTNGLSPFSRTALLKTDRPSCH